MKRVYISIPITGLPIEKVKMRADHIKAMLQTPQLQVITPFDVVDLDKVDIPENEQYAYCMGEDIKALLMCDTVYFCNGWENSQGCRAEFNIAQIYGKRILFESKICATDCETPLKQCYEIVMLGDDISLSHESVTYATLGNGALGGLQCGFSEDSEEYKELLHHFRTIYESMKRVNQIVSNGKEED